MFETRTAPAPTPAPAVPSQTSNALLALVIVVGLATGAALRFAYAIYAGRAPVATAVTPAARG